MSDASSFLARLVSRLESSGVEYMVAGSFASTFHGVPRTTHDIDVVVDLTFSGLRKLLASLPEEDYYVSESAAHDALRSRGQFNVIDMASGWKVDLIVRKDREFSRTEFGRRVRGRIAGVEVFVASAEDTVLTKLEWAMAAESERQLRDVAGVLAVAGDTMDHEYLQRWVDRLGVAEQWRRVREAGS